MEGSTSFSKDKLPRALNVPTGISRKGSRSIADATSAKDKPLQYPHLVTYLERSQWHQREYEKLRYSVNKITKKTKLQQKTNSIHVFTGSIKRNMRH